MWKKIGEKKNVIKHIGVLSIIIFLYVLFARYTFDIYIKGNTIPVYEKEISSSLTPIFDGDVIEQEIIYEGKEINAVCLVFSTNGADIGGSGNLTVELVDLQSNKVLAETKQPLKDVKDNTEVRCTFDKSINVESVQKLALRLTMKGLNDEDKLALWMAEAESLAEYNGVALENGLRMRIYTEEKDYFSLVCSIAFFVLGIIIIFSYIFIFVIKYRNIANYFLVYAILLGGLYLMFFPEYQTPDEKRHIQTAYSISNEWLGYEEADEIKMRKSDYDPEVLQPYPTRQRYNLYVDQIKSPDKVDTEMIEIGEKPLHAKKYLYLFSSLGLSLGRILNLGTVQSFLIGSIFNYIAFIIAGYYAIKKIPICKTTMMLICLLPITLQQVTSYSYDAVIIMLSLVVIALSLKIAYDDEVKKRELVILVLATLLFAPTKSFVYILVCGINLLPIVKHWKKNRHVSWILLGVYFVMILQIVLPKIIANNDVIGDTTMTGYVYWADEKAYTISDFIKTPWLCVIVFWETIINNTDFYIKSLFGGHLGWMTIEMPWFVVITLIASIAMSSVKKNNDIIQMSMKTRVMLLGICGFTTAFIMGALLLDWTPISYYAIQGVQGRYFLPFSILLVMIFRGDWIKAEEKIDGYCIYLTTLIQPVIIYRIMLCILTV